MQPGNTSLRGRSSTVHLLVLTGLDQLLLILKKLFTFVTKQVTLMRSSTVLSLSLHLVFPAETIGQNPIRQMAGILKAGILVFVLSAPLAIRGIVFYSGNTQLPSRWNY